MSETCSTISAIMYQHYARLPIYKFEVEDFFNSGVLVSVLQSNLRLFVFIKSVDP